MLYTQQFVDKKCKVELATNFTLFGIVLEVDANGIILQTKQKTSFINWSNIKTLTLDPREVWFHVLAWLVLDVSYY